MVQNGIQLLEHMIVIGKNHFFINNGGDEGIRTLETRQRLLP